MAAPLGGNSVWKNRVFRLVLAFSTEKELFWAIPGICFSGLFSVGFEPSGEKWGTGRLHESLAAT